MYRIILTALLFLSFTAIFASTVVSANEFFSAASLEKSTGLYDPSIPLHKPDVVHNYDVTYYGLHLNIDIPAESIDGYTTVTVTAEEEGMSHLTLELEDLTVDDVIHNGGSVPFTHSGGVLDINLGTSYSIGESISVNVYYHGSPTDAVHFNNDRVYTYGWDVVSKYWFPCYDDPADKADSADMYFTVQDDYIAASNGLLISRTENKDNSVTYHWQESFPICTYNICLSAADFVTIEDTFGSLPVIHYLYPEDYDDALICFEKTINMLEFFSDTFADYPYPGEKFGFCDCYVSGGMEHQTIPFIGQYFITPNYSWEWLYAHEMSHMWWGDSVGIGTWADFWLSEGFAVYSESLWLGDEYGIQEFYDHMIELAEQYFAEDATYRFSVYDPDILLSATVYNKGAWVLHMLRRVMGDGDFFTMLQDYYSTYAYDTVVTDDLQAFAESVYGDSLEWFFYQWVYMAGYPELDFTWEYSANGPDFNVEVTVDQTQEQDDITPFFNLPLDFRIHTSGGDHDFAVWMDQENEVYYFAVPDQPLDVLLDPDHWLLAKFPGGIGITLQYFRAEGVPSGISLCWEVASDEPLSGYNLYRQPITDAGCAPLTNSNSGSTPSDGWEQVNSSLIVGTNPYHYLDNGVEPNKSYRYRLEVVREGRSSILGTTQGTAGTEPTTFSLGQNYPNPASGETTIPFVVSGDETQSIILAICDISGRLIRQFEQTVQPGAHTIVWDGKDETGNPVAVGLYIYTLTSEADSQSRRLVVVK